MDPGSVDPSQADDSDAFSAPMGGTVGEGGFRASGGLPGTSNSSSPYNGGILYQQQQPPQPPYNPGAPYAAPTYSAPAPYSAPPQPPPPTMAPPPPPPQPGGSYAARSAQAHAKYTAVPNVSVVQQPPQQTPPYGNQQQQQTPPSQYYGNQQQQQQPPQGYTPQQQQQGYKPQQQQGYSPQPGYNQQQQYGGGGGPPSYAGGPPPQQQQPQPSTLNTGSYAARAQQAYATAGAGPTIASPPPAAGYQQQQQRFNTPSPTTPSQQASVASSGGGGGGYAARSAQAYATGGGGGGPAAVSSPYGGGPSPQQPPPQQQQPPSAYPQPQPPYDASTLGTTATNSNAAMYGAGGPQTPQAQAIQQRLLTDATRKVQEHAYYMRQAMDQNNLPTVLERAAYMAGELGVPPHGQHAAAGGGAAAPSLSNTGISIKLTPKNYYELYMRALEDMPSLEDYLLGLASDTTNTNPPPQQQQPQPGMYGGQVAAAAASSQFSMRELYDCVQYCPRVLSRLYLQISTGSALIRSGQVGTKWVLNDLIQCVKCEQNPIRGLFLRNHLLTVLRDKLPDGPLKPTVQDHVDDTIDNEENKTSDDIHDDDDDIMNPGTVVDSYEFVLENFMEMNKLWVRLQYLPGDGNSKDVKKRRERERNDLRILVGTNLVRISQLEGVTSKIYGEAILPRILDHVVTVGDPLSQAYLMDCLVQVFPDEYHIETLPILLNVCPRLRDKVNIRTILQGLMDRLANYLADEELLDESDTNQVKLTLARDSFGMFEDCVQKVYNARGPKLTSKEVIRLQTALLQFSLKCYPGNMEQIAKCMGACVSALQQANASFDFNTAGAPGATTTAKSLDDVSVLELEKLLSIPLESLALRVLELRNYSELIGFLPWANRRAVANTMLEAVDKEGAPPKNVNHIQQLFSVIQPLTRREGAPPLPPSNNPYQDPTAQATRLMAGLGVDTTSATTPAVAALSFGDPVDEVITQEMEQECALVSKLVHLLEHEDTDVVYEMLNIAREQIRRGSGKRASKTMVAVVFAAIKLARRIRKDETAPPPEETKEEAVVVETEEEPAVEKEDGGEAEETSEEEEKKTPEEAKEEAEPAAESKEESAEEPKEEEGPQDVASELKKGLLGDEMPAGEDALFGDDEEIVEEKEPEKGPEEEEPMANGEEVKPEEPAPKKKENLVSSRQVYLFMQETIMLIATANAEIAIKLMLEVALVADLFAAGEGSTTYAPVAYELLAQSYSLYERITDPTAQKRCLTAMIGTLLSFKSISVGEYEGLITKTAQFSAKLSKKPDQCQMVAQCAHLFFPVGGASSYSNPQRALECLQRSLKLADACTSANPSDMGLFVDLLEHYVFFLENKSPTVNAAYVTGLCALVKEYLRNATDARAISAARSHYIVLVKEIQRKKTAEPTASLFAAVEADTKGV